MWPVVIACRTGVQDAVQARWTTCLENKASINSNVHMPVRTNSRLMQTHTHINIMHIHTLTHSTHYTQNTHIYTYVMYLYIIQIHTYTHTSGVPHRDHASAWEGDVWVAQNSIAIHARFVKTLGTTDMSRTQLAQKTARGQSQAMLTGGSYIKLK